jgi:hypothetical protein
MREQVSRPRPESASAKTTAARAIKPRAKGTRADPTSGGTPVAEPVVAGVQVASTTRIRRMEAPADTLVAAPDDLDVIRRMPLSGVIQREEGDEDGTDEVESEGDGSEAADLSSVTGENGPDALEEEFNESLTKVKDATKALVGMPIGNTTQITKAKKAVTEGQELVDELEGIANKVERTKEVTDDLLDNFEGDPTGSEYTELGEVAESFASLFPKVKSGSFKANEAFVEASGQVGIAADAANQSQAQAQKIAGLRGKWTSAASAKGHYDKHKGDTGAADEEEYLTRAAALNAKKPGGSIKQKKRDGDTLTMDTATKEFTVMSSAGLIRTFFCPGGGINYFNRQ